jgi:hypothetical protein
MEIFEMIIEGLQVTANKTFISAIVTIALFFGFVTLIS